MFAGMTEDRSTGVIVDDVHETRRAFIDPFGGVGEEEFHAEVEKSLSIGFAADCAGGSARSNDASVGIVHRLCDIGVPNIAFVSHRSSEVAGGDEEDIDMVYGDDFI